MLRQTIGASTASVSKPRNADPFTDLKTVNIGGFSRVVESDGLGHFKGTGSIDPEKCNSPDGLYSQDRV
jgi:hypothetical protein